MNGVDHKEQSSRWSNVVASCGAGDWNEAIAIISDMNAVSGPSAPVLIMRGLCRLASGMDSEAVADLCAALEAPVGTDGDRLHLDGALKAVAATNASLVSHFLEVAVDALGRERALMLVRPPAAVASIPDPQSNPVELRLAEHWERVRRECAEAIDNNEWDTAEAVADGFVSEVSRAIPSDGVSPTRLLALRTQAEALSSAVRSDRSRAALDRGEARLAAIHARRAVDLLGPRHAPEHVVSVRALAARTALALEATDEALFELQEAARHSRSRSDRALVGELLAEVGDAARERREGDIAVKAYEQAAALYEGAGGKDVTATALALALRTAASRLRRDVDAS